MAVGLGAQVTIVDVSAGRMAQIDDIFGGRVTTLMSNNLNIAEVAKQADLLIGAVLITGAKCPKIVTEQMVKTMNRCAVIVDVAIDQGGSIETIDRTTTHTDPIYLKHDVVHYAVANMPALVPRTSTFALTNVTLPFAIELADKGVEKALKENAALAHGLNTIDGRCTYKPVADALALAYKPI